MNVLGVQRTCKVNIRRLRWSTSKTTGAKTSGCRRASVRDCLVTVCEGQIFLVSLCCFSRLFCPSLEMSKGWAKEGPEPREIQREGRVQGSETRLYLELFDVCRSYRLVYVLSLIHLFSALSLEPVY